MADKKTRILTAVVFVAVVILSLLLAIKKTIEKRQLAFINGVPITETGSFSGLNPLEKNIVLALRELTVPDSAINSSFIEESGTREIEVDVPLGKPMEEIINTIQQCALKTTYVVEDSYYSSKKDYARMQFSSPREIEKTLVMKLKRTEEEIYFKQNLSIYLIVTGIDTISAKTRLRYLTFDGTLSYELPVDAPQIDSVAFVLKRYELPMIVRIPLESKQKTISNDYTLRIDDSRGVIESKMSELNRRIPTITAISSDAGDLFLDERGSTSDLFEVLGDHDFIFIDNRKSPNDRALQIAKHNKVSYFRNVKELTGETTADYTQELRRISLSARREVVVRAQASVHLINALEKNSNYFEKTGVSFQGITSLSNE